MNKRELQKFARLLIGKTLGLTVAAKNVCIEDFEHDGIDVTFFVFTILGFDIRYILRAVGHDRFKFWVRQTSRCGGNVITEGMFVFDLKLEDLED